VRDRSRPCGITSGDGGIERTLRATPAARGHSARSRPPRPPALQGVVPHGAPCGRGHQSLGLRCAPPLRVPCAQVRSLSFHIGGLSEERKVHTN
jgi:hypothetical protein